MLEHFDTVMSFAVVMLLLSLLVTTFVQMIIAATGLRAAVLQDGLSRLLLQAFPSLPEADAAKISEAVLRHPMISSVNGRRATSIRKDELIRLLEDIANRGGTSAAPEAKALFTGAQTALKTATATIQTPEFAAASKALKEAIASGFPAQAAQLHGLVDEALVGGRKLVQDVGAWFDTVMDRTTENFLAKTRWITAGVALALAFILHVDSLRIIRQLASQPELRAKLIQSADATLRKAEGTFALTAEAKALGSAAIATVKADLGSSPDAQVITNVPPDLVTREAGEAWLNAKFTSAPNRETILAAYRTRFEEKTEVWLNDLRLSVREINTSLRQSDLTIIPSPTPPLSDYVDQPGHFLGTVMTVLFLSLGAPFWYNTLRQLANLRPAVAEKIEPKSRSNK